jgi:methylase of polypeptide subunit release factors
MIIVAAMAARLKDLVRDWQASSVGSESTLHQLAPYIGKLETTVASSLLETYSHERDTVIDPFCGSGVVALEALLRKRSVVANDINPYRSLPFAHALPARA